MKKSIMVIDAETDGLWGKPFCIAAIIYEYAESEQEWIKTRTTVLRCNLIVKNPWVIENVLPAIRHIPFTHDARERQVNYNEMLSDFGMWYMQFKNDCEIVWHMGGVVETFLFREMVRIGAIGEWDAPYTPIEVSTLLMAAGEAPDSVEKYVEKYLPACALIGQPHDPVHDCEVTAQAFFHLVNRLNLI